MRRRAGGILLCMVIAALVAATPAFAQATASLRGKVLDETGEPMPGVVVKLANPSAPVGNLAVVTDTSGVFVFLSLPAGREYTLTATVPDYATIVAGPLDLTSGKETRLSLTLKKSSDLEETVRVEARGDVVELQNTTVAAAYNAEFIEGLPLVGRSFQDLSLIHI